MRGWLLLLCLALAGCDYTTRTRDIGYKGRARLDAYLAAARFFERQDYEVINKPGWPDLENNVAVIMAPASVLSTDAYVREVREWVEEGGHLICLIENAESFRNDWNEFKGFVPDNDEVLPAALEVWLKDAGLTVSHGDGSKVETKRLTVDEESFEVFCDSFVGIQKGNRARRAMAQEYFGDGLITVMADARPFRNRYIGDLDHAALLQALVDMSPYEGSFAIVRDGGLSLWALLWRNGWPALVGLLLVAVFWLWKNMPRFGPLRREDEPTNLRDYDHHLEALGDFQWRLDKGAAMLRPLRDSVFERAHRQLAGTHRDGDLFEWMARRAGMTRDRAERAMTHERPTDATSFTRVVADLQQLHHSLT